MTRGLHIITAEDTAHAASLTDGEIAAIMFDGENAECSDGCMVEPDGTCEHGRPSPLIVLGVI